MVRVHVICEGQTEETFVKEVLSRGLLSKNIYLSPALVGKPGQKGGALTPQRLLRDIRLRLLGDTTAYCTTLFDYYRLPRGFPGREEALGEQFARNRARCICSGLTEFLRPALGEEAVRRFIPYVQMHEFEGLLFSSPIALATGISQPQLVSSLQAIRASFDTPEDINEGAESAPSKRITNLYPAYDKPLFGSLAAMEMGSDVIRKECPLFNEWVLTLETLSNDLQG